MLEAWPGARFLLRSRKPPPLGRWRRRGGSGCPSGLLEQKVLGHGLLNVPLGKVFIFSGLGFLSEVPALHLRLRLLSPSHRCVDECLWWPREASGSGQAVGGWREWCCWGNQAVIRSESPGSGWGICSCVPDSQPWAWDLEELMCPIPDLGAQPLFTWLGGS